MLKKLPAIVSDIDGVLLKSKDVIQGSDKALKYIRQPIQKLNINTELLEKNKKYNFQNQLVSQSRIPQCQQIPFLCVTNGGGVLEQIKARNMNGYLGLNDNICPVNKNDIHYNKLDGEDIVLNYTPVRQILEEQYKNKPILLVGQGNMNTIAESMGLKQYITIKEYADLYPLQVEHFWKPHNLDFESLQNKISQRFQISVEDLQKNNSFEKINNPLNIEGIFVLNDPVGWEDCMQIMSDLCMPKDNLFQYQRNKQQLTDRDYCMDHMPIYTVNNDLTFAAKYHIDRFANGLFMVAFKNIFKEIVGHYPKVNEYGKPTLNTYNYVENNLRNKSAYEIGNFYMIGDNPKSDIRGARLKGWKSILVKTGVFKGDNDLIDPADFVVQDFHEAVNLICDLEDIQQIR